MDEATQSKDWIDDCIKFHGCVLTGEFAYWCPEFDDLPIDETTDEFEFCNCYPTSEADRD